MVSSAAQWAGGRACGGRTAAAWTSSRFDCAIPFCFTGGLSGVGSACAGLAFLMGGPMSMGGLPGVNSVLAPHPIPRAGRMPSRGEPPRTLAVRAGPKLGAASLKG